MCGLRAPRLTHSRPLAQTRDAQQEQANTQKDSLMGNQNGKLGKAEYMDKLVPLRSWN